MDVHGILRNQKSNLDSKFRQQEDSRFYEDINVRSQKFAVVSSTPNSGLKAGKFSELNLAGPKDKLAASKFQSSHKNLFV